MYLFTQKKKLDLLLYIPCRFHIMLHVEQALLNTQIPLTRWSPWLELPSEHERSLSSRRASLSTNRLPVPSDGPRQRTAARQQQLHQLHRQLLQLPGCWSSRLWSS